MSVKELMKTKIESNQLHLQCRADSPAVPRSIGGCCYVNEIATDHGQSQMRRVIASIGLSETNSR
jgi:hypothetical protein